MLAATPENFAQYGTILGDVDGASKTSNHYSAVRVVNPSKNFATDADACVLVLCYEPRALECKFMERHYKHTQTFIPLEGKPLIGFFAPPNDKDEPDLDKAVCFRFDGTAGFCMHKGTWHEQPFPELPGSKAVCILRNETVRELKPTDVATSECHGEDIDKLNLVARHDLVFTSQLIDAADGAVGPPRSKASLVAGMRKKRRSLVSVLLSGAAERPLLAALLAVLLAMLLRRWSARRC